MPRNELFDYMIGATKEMATSYNLIRRRTQEDPGTAGDQGEENWAALFKVWLPQYFHVVTKGRILNHEGQTSPQVDVLILSPAYPKELLNKKLYLAGGVEAAFECKTTLRPEHIQRAVQTASAIRKLLPERQGTPYKEMHSPIIYGLLAHSHGWKSAKSTPLKNISTKLMESDKSFTEHPREMLDFVCVADLATWKAARSAWWPIQDPSNLLNIIGWTPSTTYFYPTKNNNGELGHVEGYTPIGSLLTQLMQFLAWGYTDMRELSMYFVRSNLMGSGEGLPRLWDLDVFSEEVRTKLPTHVTSGVHWSEWGMVF